MGNDGQPRPGYDVWVSYDGHGRLNDPTLNEGGRYVKHTGYVTDIMPTRVPVKSHGRFSMPPAAPISSRMGRMT